MYSTRCTYCRQLINLKTEEVRAAIEEATAKKEKIYVIHCPKCRKLVKIQVKQLKLKLPMEAPASAPVAGEQEQPEETPSGE